MVIAARLRRTADIQNARAGGVSFRDQLFAMHVLPRPAGALRLSVSTQRGVGSAVRRNRARRRVREAFRVELRSRSSAPSIDAVVTVRRSAVRAPAASIRAAAARAIDAASRVRDQ